MEEQGIIEEDTGPAPWVSNAVLAPKDDGGIRVTVDMRNANDAIIDTDVPIQFPERKTSGPSSPAVTFSPN